MTVEFHLDKEDIRRLVAKEYGVLQNQVDVICFENTVGYGEGEHEEPDVEIVVKKLEEKI